MANKLNRIAGITKILSITTSEMIQYGNKTLEAGIFIRRADGKLLLTDGITALNQLSPIIDESITEYEKLALSTAFIDGRYVATSGGVVIHDEEGKISDGELHLVQNGKIVRSYLADLVDEEGMIRIDKLPLTAKASISYFNTYEDMATNATEDQKSGALYVINASDDPSGMVHSGAAMYIYEPQVGTTPAQFRKIAEVESLDLDISSITVTRENVEQAGACLYDHSIIIESPTLAELAELEANGD